MAQVNNRSALHDSELLSVLDSIVVDLGVLRTPANALVTDISNVRVTANDAASDLDKLASEVNVIVAKLNADGGVSDTNYVSVTTPAGSAATALTAVAATALTTTSD